MLKNSNETKGLEASFRQAVAEFCEANTTENHCAAARFLNHPPEGTELEYLRAQVAAIEAGQGVKNVLLRMKRAGLDMAVFYDGAMWGIDHHNPKGVCRDWVYVIEKEKTQ